MVEKRAKFRWVHSSRSRTGNSSVAILATVVALAVVLGTVFWMNRTPTDSDRAIAQSGTPNDRESSVTEETTPASDLDRLAADRANVDRAKPAFGSRSVTEQPADSSSSDVALAENDATLPAADEEPSAETTSTANPADQVSAHLAAGEYGLAGKVADAVADAQLRAVLFRQIADVQADVGEFAAADAAIGRISLPERRGEAHRQRLVQETLAGGGSLADFSELINLITFATQGPWAPDDPDKTLSPFTTGVHVDPHGQLALLSRTDAQNRLKNIGTRARQADLNQDMSRKSDLRLISLRRLEQEVARRLEAGESVLKTMQHLAGISQIRYVFVDRQQNDVLIGGPAEAWEYDASGRAIGVESGRPMFYLDDLVTVMRIFSPVGSNVFNCLIVPRQAGLKKLKEVVDRSNARGSLRPGAGVQNFARKCGEALGPQDAVFGGVANNTRVARVMLEADYKMKLIGIDRLDGGSAIPSYFDLLDAKTVKQNPPTLDAMRWWLTMKYDAVLHDNDRNVFEIQGSSVRCQSENEQVTATGERIHTGVADPTNREFASKFTAGYAQLAQREPIFAELQNIFDLALVAALLRHENLASYPQDYGVFAAGGAYQPQRYTPPQTVDTAYNHRVYNGRDVIVQVAGGVQADLASVLKDSAVYRSAARLPSLGSKAKPPQLPAGRWWWDAQ